MDTEPRSRWVFFDNGISTARAADALSVLKDLDRASDFAHALVALDEPYGGIQTDALFIAALVQYGRAFSSGDRNAYKARSELAVRLPSDHQYFSDLRDKWIAHSLNTFESHQVAAMLVEGPDKLWSITHVQTFGENTGALAFKVPQFLQLCSAVRALVMEDLLAAMRDAEGDLRALSNELLDALPDGRMNVIDVERPDLRRRQRRPKRP